MRVLLTVSLVLLILSAVAESAMVNEYKAVQAAVAALRRQSCVYSTDNAAMKVELREIEIAGEIMTGKRKECPRISVATNLVRVVLGGEPWSCVSAGGKNLNQIERLGLPDEKTYLIEAEVRSEDMKGPVKFGGYVPVRGSDVQWPGVDIGGGTFDWRRVSFVYRLPRGGQLAVCFGPNSNVGRVWFRNVRVFELEERER